jgi:hypothetical protein
MLRQQCSSSGLLLAQECFVCLAGFIEQEGCVEVAAAVGANTVLVMLCPVRCALHGANA